MHPQAVASASLLTAGLLSQINSLQTGSGAMQSGVLSQQVIPSMPLQTVKVWEFPQMAEILFL
jgi:hypothetical protein